MTKIAGSGSRIRIHTKMSWIRNTAPKVLVPQLATASGYQKLAIAILIIQWLELPGGAPDCLDRTTLPAALLHCLNTTWNFSEVASLRARLLSAGQDYLASLKHSHPSGAVDRLFKRELCSPEDVEELVGPVTEHLLAEARGLKARTVETLMERRAGLAILLQSYRAEQAGLERITMASLAGALVHIGPGVLPEKLNPVIRPLMEAVKSETNEEFQAVLLIRIHRIHMFLGLPDPDPLVRCMDPDLIFLSSCKYSKKNLDSYYFVTLVDFLSLKNDVNAWYLQKVISRKNFC
jgi:hypothetical protein